MSIYVYIDNNVWDFLFEQQIDLSAELPAPEFTLCITREAAFEITPMPEYLRSFVKEALNLWQVKSIPYFGFDTDSRHLPEEQRWSGWDAGCWASKKEYQFIKSEKARLSAEKKPKTRLYCHEADLALAAHSFGAVVLTFDKKGLLLEAYNKGGSVIFLDKYRDSHLSLRDFILSYNRM